MDDKPRSKTYAFSLRRNENDQWYVLRIVPEVSANTSVNYVLPEELIRYIAAFPVFPNKIIEKKEFCPPFTVRRRFNIRFVKYSNDHILGSISEVFEYRPPGKKPRNADYVDATVNPNKNPIEIKKAELERYMQMYPKLRD